MKYSFMFFSSGEGNSATASLKQILELARFADDNGLHRVWLPERHFVKFGALHPNPAVLAAAVATQTRRVRVAAGSVVAPLHDPLRICEEWSVVDNLSGGRVDMALASGWRAEDFSLAPDNYAERHGVLEQRISEVRRLWNNHSVERRDGEGRLRQVRTLPRPLQAELPLWVTATRNAKTFEMAGRVGANLLTYLVDLGLDGLAHRLAIYRQARAQAGYSGPGVVTVMLHTYLGEDTRQVRQRIAPQYERYLFNNRELLGRPGEHATVLLPSDAQALASAQFERMYERLSLIGGIEQCRPLINKLEALGVNEIACLIDFVDDWQMIGEALPALLALSGQSAPAIGMPTAETEPVATVPSPLLHAGQAEFYAHISSLGGQYGSQFQWVQSVTVNETEARSRLTIPPTADPAAWRAQLVDAAISTAHAIGMQPGLRASSRPLALPVAIGKIWFAPGAQSPDRNEPRDYSVHTCRRSGFQRQDGAIAFDIKVTNGDGKPVLSMEKLCLQRMPQFDGDAAHAASFRIMHGLCWTDSALPDSNSAATIVLRPVCMDCAPAVPLLAALAAEVQLTALTEKEERAGNIAEQEQEIAVWCNALTEDSCHVAIPFDGHASAILTKRILGDLMTWTQSSPSSNEATTLLVLTQGANQVNCDGPQGSLTSAAVWAAAASLQASPSMSGMLVLDLDPQLPLQQQAQAIVRLLRARTRGCLALRAGRVWHVDLAATLGRSLSVDRDRLPIPAHARVLITGGTGGLGRALTGWILAEGAAMLRIASRNAHRAESWARQLREADDGLVLELVDADIATADGAQAAVSSDSGQPLAWDVVFHLAGDAVSPWGDQCVPDALERCLRPKLDGLLQLCEAWGDHRPRQLILFSSIAALNGSAGQPCYAAANAAFAAMARLHPLLQGVDLRICWFGPWDGEGMAGVPALREVFVSKGLVAMQPWIALRGLRDMLSSPCAQAIIALSSGADAEVDRPTTAIAAKPAILALLGDLMAAADAATQARLLRAAVLQMIGAILEVAPCSLHDDRNLYELGFDSLMAIEFKHRVQDDFGVELNLSTLLESGTIDQLVLAFLPLLLTRARTMDKSESQSASAPPADPCFELVL